MIRTSVYFLAFVLGALGVPRHARADLIYNNFGPNQSYFISAGSKITGTAATYLGVPVQPSTLAVGFTPAASYTLTAIDAGLTWVDGTDGVTLSLYTDASGVPGTALESWNVTNLPFFGTTESIIQTVFPAMSIRLDAGQTYWVVAAPLAPDSYDVWNVNMNGGSSPGGKTAANNGSGWVVTSVSNNQLALDVQGALITAISPEPGTCSLMALSLLSLPLLIRRNRHPM